MNSGFTTVQWVNNSIIYEVNLRQYTAAGSFKAFENHIPRLKEMGVDIIWLMPITPISNVGRKGSLGSYYACSSYTKINPEFGTEQDFLSLVQLIHKYEMKVIIDWVANHTGKQHEWMQEHPHWFCQDNNGNFTERNGWEDVVDLNYENKEMREALIGAMLYWVRTFNIDGFRCDMAHLVPLDFWRAARKATETIKTLFWLAETEQVNYHEVFDASYAWSWMHTTEKIAQGQEGVNELYNICHNYTQYPKNAYKLFFTSNHDENSWNGTEYEKYGITAKAWAVFTFMWKGLPLIYSGQELPNYKRLAFFDKDPIDWSTTPALATFYQLLAATRKKYANAINGETCILPHTQNAVLAFLKFNENQVLLILLNVSTQIQKLQMEHHLLIGQFTNIFSGLSFQFNKKIDFELLPGDYFVYVKSGI